MAKILFVDDQPDHSSLIVKYLEKAGHRVASLPNGKERWRA